MKTIVQLVPRNQFTLMQEQAKAELEKIQAAKDKKEQKEQEKVEKAKVLFIKRVTINEIIVKEKVQYTVKEDGSSEI